MNDPQLQILLPKIYDTEFILQYLGIIIKKKQKRLKYAKTVFRVDG